MHKFIPSLLSIALLLVLMSACNRDATEAGKDGTGTFLAPAAAPPSASVRMSDDESKPTESPTIGAESAVPEVEPGAAEKLTEEEMRIARNAGPGRTAPMPTTRQTATPRTAEAAVPTTSGSKPVIDFDRPVMSLHKTACNGNCRQYDLTLTNDRRLVLAAGRNMKRKGNYSRALSAREYNEILVAMQAANPEGLAHLYPEVIENVPADAQGTLLSFPGQDGKERKVEVYYGAPEKLDALISTFEAWVDKDGWIRMAE